MGTRMVDGMGSAEADEVDGHADAEERENDCQGYGGAAGLAGLPGSGGELLDHDEMIDDGGDVDRGRRARPGLLP